MTTARDHVDRVAKKGETWLRVTLNKNIYWKDIFHSYPLQVASKRPLVVPESPDMAEEPGLVSDEEHCSGG